MKYFLAALIVGFFLVDGTMCFSQSFFPQDIYKFIENPGILELNQEPGHVHLVAFENQNKAEANLKDPSQGYLSLNGNWKFQYSEIMI